TDLVVSFNTADATPAAVSALIEHIGYANNSENPSTAARSVLFTVNDGDGASGSDTATINVTAVNDAPSASAPSAHYSATEQTDLALQGTGLLVSDVDGQSGSETVTLTVGEGIIAVNAGDSNVAGLTNNGTSSVSFSGTIAQLNALLGGTGTGTITYNDNLDDPSANTQLTLSINDNGNSGSALNPLTATPATATIDITAVNDPPVNTVPGAQTIDEDASLTISGLQVNDPDIQLGNITVTLSVSHGTIHVDPNVPGGIDSTDITNNDSASVTLQCDPAFVNVTLATGVSYTPDLNYNGSDTLTMLSDDSGATGTGGLQTDSDPVTITINPVNDQVAISAPASVATNEDTSVAVTGLSISDVDANYPSGASGNYSVTLSASHGTLTLGTTAGLSFDSGTANGTATLTFHGTLTNINAALATASYTGNTNYNGTDTIAFSATDVFGVVATGSGPATSDSGSISVTINSVNDAPVLSGLGDTPAFIENDAPVVLDTNSNASVSDVELDVSANHYSGATLTLARNGGADPDDVFGSVGSLDLTDVNGNGENVSLDGGATFIGTATNADGTFSITFNANATAADVDSVMRQISYFNSSDNPPASVQIDFTFNDGNGQPGGQAQGSGATPGVSTGSITVAITQVDDPPQLVNVAPTAAYSPGSPGAVLSSALGVFDPDATPPSPVQGIHSGTVQIASGLLAGDELFVNLASSGGHLVTADGVTTNISASYAAGTLTLSGTDTVSDYQSVLDAVSYRSTAVDPSNGGTDPNRTITWSVNDGVLNSQTPGPDVNETVLHFDTAPAVDLDGSSPGTGYTTTYTTSTPAIPIVNNDLVTDPDTANADSMTIVLTNAMTGDALS
ncbi:MAG: hypothetical protein QOH67_4344, partial [Hyphomicrobiales bacterium]|nr:hypothetical protein [Hyphomicrobiales bacterium]